MKPILREAETKDMKSIMILLEKLVDFESGISDIPIIEDRKDIVMKIIAHALVDPDRNIWVVEKSGRILGVFIARKETRFGIEALNPVCVFSHAYNQKTVLSFYEINNKVRKWAKMKGCKSIQMIALIKNEKVQKIFEGLGYNKTAMIYELEL